LLGADYQPTNNRPVAYQCISSADWHGSKNCLSYNTTSASIVLPKTGKKDIYTQSYENEL